MIDLPVRWIHVESFIENVQRNLVLSKQIQGMSNLLKVVRILWVEPYCFLKNAQGFFDEALLSENDGFNEDRVMQKATLACRHRFLNQVQAFSIILHVEFGCPTETSRRMGQRGVAYPPGIQQMDSMISPRLRHCQRFQGLHRSAFPTSKCPIRCVKLSSYSKRGGLLVARGRVQESVLTSTGAPSRRMSTYRTNCGVNQSIMNIAPGSICSRGES